MSERPAIWRRDGFSADRWTRLGPDERLPEEGAVLVDLDQWRQIVARNAPAPEIGLLLPAGHPVEEIASDLDRLGLIGLDFPSFTDGRSYSAARLLRERFGFAGELRATGNVLIDQLPLMLRCGFDSFAISHGPTRRALAEGPLPDMPLYMQPAGERDEVPAGTRPWLRRRAH